MDINGRLRRRQERPPQHTTYHTPHDTPADPEPAGVGALDEQPRRGPVGDRHACGKAQDDLRVRGEEKEEGKGEGVDGVWGDGGAEEW